MNRIQSKNHKIGTYAINKNYLSCFDGKIHILDNGISAIALGANIYNPKNIYQNLSFGLIRSAFLSGYKIVNFRSNQNSFFDFF